MKDIKSIFYRVQKKKKNLNILKIMKQFYKNKLCQIFYFHMCNNREFRININIISYDN